MIRDTANKIVEGLYGMLPYQTAVHLANAQKEFLHAIGSMIDEQIKWTDIHVERAHGKQESGARRSPTESALEERLHP